MCQYLYPKVQLSELKIPSLHCQRHTETALKSITGYCQHVNVDNVMQAVLLEMTT